MEIIISSIIIVATIFAVIINTYFGCCMFLISRILIPENARFLNTGLSINTLIILITFLALLISKKRKLVISRIDGKYLRLIIGLFFVFFVLILPSNYGDLLEQIIHLIQFGLTELMPAIMALFLINSSSKICTIERVFIYCTIISCTYGVVTVLIGANPYIDSMANWQMNLVSWKGIATSATFVSTNTFGYFLALAVPYSFYLYDAYHKTSDRKMQLLIKVAIMLELICILLCKKRSAFITCAFFLMILSFGKLTYKVFIRIIIIFLLVVLLFIILTNVAEFSKLGDYIKATIFFWNDNAVEGIASTGQLGSTWELRIRQVTYPFKEIKDNYLFGHGFGWTAWYLDKFRLHPFLFGFETIISLCLCENGLLGPILYGCFFKKSYNYMKKYSIRKPNIEMMYVLCYVVNTIATGRNYFFLFCFITVLIAKRNHIINSCY